MFLSQLGIFTFRIFAHLLTSEQKAELNGLGGKLEDATTAQVAVLTIDSLEGDLRRRRLQTWLSSIEPRRFPKRAPRGFLAEAGARLRIRRACSAWWPRASSRFFATLHEASGPEGAVVDELKLRILDSDRMPIGQLERAARAGRGELYPQSLLGRQVYWTVVGEFDREGRALFDEYGDLEPRRGSPQITSLLRVGDRLHGAPASASIRHSLVGGSLPIPSVIWSIDGLEIRATALAHAGQALVEYRIVNTSRAPRDGALVLAVRPAQINPYWQHGGHAPIDAIAVIGREARIDDQIYAAFSREPDAVTVADFDDGDVVRLIERRASGTDRSLCSDLGRSAPLSNSLFRCRPRRVKPSSSLRRCETASHPMLT